MRTLVINLCPVDADAVLSGHQSAILRRVMPSGCARGMRVIFHHNGFMMGEATITGTATGTAENIAARFAGQAWQTIADAAELLDGARRPGVILISDPRRYEPARRWYGIQPLGHIYL